MPRKKKQQLQEILPSLRPRRILEIAEFVKQHSSFYNSRDKQWCNPKLKEKVEGTSRNLYRLHLPASEEDLQGQIWQKREEGKQKWCTSKRKKSEGRSNHVNLLLFHGYITCETILVRHNFLPCQRSSPALQQMEDEPSPRRDIKDCVSGLSGQSAASVTRSSKLREKKRRSSVSSEVLSLSRAEETLSRSSIRRICSCRRVNPNDIRVPVILLLPLHQASISGTSQLQHAVRQGPGTRHCYEGTA